MRGSNAFYVKAVILPIHIVSVYQSEPPEDFQTDSVRLGYNDKTTPLDIVVWEAFVG